MSIFKGYKVDYPYPIVVMYARNLSNEKRKKLKIIDDQVWAYFGHGRECLYALEPDDIEFFIKYLIRKKLK